ncbi:wiskott-Aldrich syndrome protein homolog 1-like [Onychostruthus taczanowskii]|uniref:wiskott-Aldrich syndrome protein homolog 1-like n=1 Tax=Onychostruthus taczanowskii TaxID=356909 RepID=UPI001B80C2D6|nr:wiskott-Aldrich syndrome protein homolog 1-like [Onychostruthus taczanowskii]
MGTWREGGRNSAPLPPPATLASDRCRAPAALRERLWPPGAARVPLGGAQGHIRAPAPPPALPPAAAAGAAGAAGLRPARVTCAERGSPASPPRPRRSGDAGAPEADTAARSPARPRRPPPPPPPARTNSRRRTGTGRGAGLPGGHGRAHAEGPHGASEEPVASASRLGRDCASVPLPSIGTDCPERLWSLPHWRC